MKKKISNLPRPLLQHHLGVLVVVFAGVLLAMLGCSDNVQRVPVSGRVLLDGKPLATGVITVIPKGFRPAGSKIVNGEFSLMTYKQGDGTALGTHTVIIYSAEVLGSERRWLIPKHYSEAARSGLTITVDSPTDEAIFELSWGKEKPIIDDLNIGR